tara:strand:+ start:540 stop:1094 length:555 start_codon:yes stop_codon:yes gene_type:complete
MSYQGHAVNFSQPSQQQFNDLMMEVGRNNYQTSINSQNLIQMGKDMTKIGQDNTYFGTAITNLDTAVRQIISQGVGGGMTRQQVENIVEDYHGDDIALLHSNSISLGDSQQAAKLQRDSMEAKIKSNKDEHGYFHDTVQTLGDKMLEHSNSPHNQGGGGGIWQYLPLIAVGGLAAYLFKGKLKL